MSNEIRLMKWQNWCETLSEFRREVQMEIERNFRPYWKYPAANDFYAKLEALTEFVHEQTELEEAEMLKYYDAFDMYNAWRLGLCPAVMKPLKDACRDAEDAGHIENWRDISHCREHESMSREDTLSAIRTWEFLKNATA